MLQLSLFSYDLHSMVIRTISCIFFLAKGLYLVDLMLTELLLFYDANLRRNINDIIGRYNFLGNPLSPSYLDRYDFFTHSQIDHIASKSWLGCLFAVILGNSAKDFQTTVPGHCVATISLRITFRARGQVVCSDLSPLATAQIVNSPIACRPFPDGPKLNQYSKAVFPNPFSDHCVLAAWLE